MGLAMCRVKLDARLQLLSCFVGAAFDSQHARVVAAMSRVSRVKSDRLFIGDSGAAVVLRLAEDVRQHGERSIVAHVEVKCLPGIANGLPMIAQQQACLAQEHEAMDVIRMMRDQSRQRGHDLGVTTGIQLAQRQQIERLCMSGLSGQDVGAEVPGGNIFLECELPPGPGQQLARVRSGGGEFVVALASALAGGFFNSLVQKSAE